MTSRHAESIILRGRWVVSFIHFAFAWRRLLFDQPVSSSSIIHSRRVTVKGTFSCCAVLPALNLPTSRLSQKYLFLGSSENICTRAFSYNLAWIRFALSFTVTIDLGEINRTYDVCTYLNTSCFDEGQWTVSTLGFDVFTFVSFRSVVYTRRSHVTSSRSIGIIYQIISIVSRLYEGKYHSVNFCNRNAKLNCHEVVVRDILSSTTFVSCICISRIFRLTDPLTSHTTPCLLPVFIQNNHIKHIYSS